MLSVSQHDSKIATIWTTSYSETAVQTHVITVSVWWHSTFYCQNHRLDTSAIQFS